MFALAIHTKLCYYRYGIHIHSIPEPRLQFKACYIQKHITKPNHQCYIHSYNSVYGSRIPFQRRRKKRNKIIMCVHFFFFCIQCCCFKRVFNFLLWNVQFTSMDLMVCDVNFLCGTCKESKGNKTQPPNQLQHFKWIKQLVSITFSSLRCSFFILLLRFFAHNYKRQSRTLDILDRAYTLLTANCKRFLYYSGCNRDNTHLKCVHVTIDTYHLILFECKQM